MTPGERFALPANTLNALRERPSRGRSVIHGGFQHGRTSPRYAGQVLAPRLALGFRDDGFWARLQENNPLEWADAVAFDEASRHGSARANAGGKPLRGT